MAIYKSEDRTIAPGAQRYGSSNAQKADVDWTRDRRHFITQHFPAHYSDAEGLDDMYSDLLHFAMDNDLELRNWARGLLSSQLASSTGTEELTRAVMRVSPEERFEVATSFLYNESLLHDEQKIKQYNKFAKEIARDLVTHLDAGLRSLSEDDARLLATICMDWSAEEKHTRSFLKTLRQEYRFATDQFMLQLACDVRDRAQNLCWYHQNFGASEVGFRNALIVFEEFCEPQDEGILGTTFWVGECLRKQGKYAEAEPYHRRSLDQRLTYLSPGDERIKNAAFGLVEDLKNQGCLSEANEFMYLL